MVFISVVSSTRIIKTRATTAAAIIFVITKRGWMVTTVVAILHD